ncbi:MAG TPA: hypothetical protein ENI68_04235 [Gammaproteobacteria bacterium]|nr:hypothetical protein [Gammaproteobacteria bacterium]
MTKAPPKIGRLACTADVNVETVRYYQRRGLIVEPEKPAYGFRLPTAALMLLLLAFSLVTANAAPQAQPMAVEITQPLTLNQAVQLALARNLDTKSARNALQAAEAARRVAVGKLYPHIKALSGYDEFPQQKALLLPRHMDVPALAEISGATGRETTQSMLNYLDVQFQDRVLNIGLGLKWPLYTGGQLTAKVEHGCRSQRG